MFRLTRLVAVLVGLVSLAVVGLVRPAEAGPGPGVACGATITQNTTLTGDLGCPSTAIRFGADNITLNLNGFRVFKTGATNCDCPGIHVHNRTGDRIMRGVVQGFSTGIFLEGGGRHTITAVIARDNVGILTGDTLFGEGIQLFESNNNVIQANQLIRNGTFSGINLYDSGGNTVRSNVVAQNNIIQQNASHGGPTVMQDIGIWIISLSSAGRSSNNLVASNSVTGNGLDGIQISRFSGAAGPNTVIANNVAGNGFGQAPGRRVGDGIAVFGQDNLVQGNNIVRNASHGLAVRNSTAPGNRLIRNRAFGNNAGPDPDPAFDLFDANPACLPNVWSGNIGGTAFPPCTRNP